MKQPFFSIIVPTCARPKQLAACLQALVRLDYPRDCFEVIVVDDGSQAPLEGVIAPFCKQLDLLLLTQPNAGPAAARNTGAACAKGKFLAFTDDDCRPAPAWLQTLAARFAMTPDRLIGGRTINALPHNLYAVTSQLMMEAVYAYFNAKPHHAHFLATNNFALPADYFLALGGFDTTFTRAAGEDNEFCKRWLHHGYRMTYAPEVVVYHAHLLTFRSFWKQHFNYGRAAFHLHQVSPRRGWGCVKAEPQFYFYLFRYPFVHVRSLRVLLLEALLVVSHMAKTAGFLREKIQGIHEEQTPDKRE